MAFRKRTFKVGDVLEAVHTLSVRTPGSMHPNWPEYFDLWVLHPVEPGEKLLVTGVRIPGEQYWVSAWGQKCLLLMQTKDYHPKRVCQAWLRVING